jgi:predicted DNA-binding transcriptional regulator YafY
MDSWRLPTNVQFKAAACLFPLRSCRARGNLESSEPFDRAQGERQRTIKPAFLLFTNAWLNLSHGTGEGPEFKMRRADRLFEIVHHLRGRRLTTAAQLAKWLEVSERTIYRDIADLLKSGMPIDGEAGVGYRLHPDFDLPPLMFNHTEVEALVIGARMVEAWGGSGLAQGARSALAKIAMTLPIDKRATLEASPLFSPVFDKPHLNAQMDMLRKAIAVRQYVQLGYRDADGRETQRRIRALGLFFWGDAWTLGAWCELRNDFRSFRLDRMNDCQLLAEQFTAQSERGLADYLRKVSCEELPPAATAAS